MLAQDNVRSKRGHAAVSMKGAGAGDSSWVVIQRNTFTNWVNEILRPKGDSVEDLQTDFCDGVRLVALVEELQGSPVGKKVVRNAPNQHQRLENVSIALNAISNDNVKLVNIGSEDIVNGNLKLILGLIWHLILRYHIGKTKFPPKKLMLAWLQSVVPSCRISNFSKNWNDGVALHGVIEYCQPGLCPDWQKLDRSKKVENCHNAMNIANEKFDIPLILRPEDLSSPHLDELSGMTYLSYFMKQDSPGYHATLNRVRKMLNHNVKNFTTDWNDGQLVCQLVRSVGGNIQDGHISGTNEEVLQKGLDAGKELGIEPILTAKQMSEEHEEHLGIMAYAASFHHLKKTCPPEQKLALDADLDNVYVGNPTKVQMTLTETDVPTSSIKMEVTGPDSSPPVHLQWKGDNGVATFTPTQTGHHMLTAYCENKIVNGCPKNFKVNADRSKIVCSQFDRCCVGTITEVKVNTTTAGQGDVRVEAKSPGGHVHNPPVMSRQGIYSANFTPTEVGDWNMGIFYDGEHIDGSPFTVNVFDPAQVQIYGLEGGAVGQALNFNADTSKAGIGDFRANIQHNGRSVPSRVTKGGTHNYKINFTPQGAGLYQISGFFNDVEIKGSPYTMEIVDSSMVSVTGQGLGMVPVNQFATFEVSTRGAGGGDVKVEIISPSNKTVQSKVTCKDNDTYKVEYMPTEPGEHNIQVHYAGQLLKNCTMTSKTFDVGRVAVVDMPTSGVLGKEIEFEIDASQAGPGDLEIKVNNGSIPCYIQNHGNHKFTASFIPENVKTQKVQMMFNGYSVKGSPWDIQILGASSFRIAGEGLHLVPVRQPASFKVTGPTVKDGLDVSIQSPAGEPVPVSKRPLQDQVVMMEYIPTEIGSYNISVKYANENIEGSPFTAKSFDISRVIISEIPRTGIVGSSVDFTIDASKSGDGQLEIMVNNGSLPNTVTKERQGVYCVSFVPEQKGPHFVGIIFNGQSLPDSPYECRVADVSQAVVRNLNTRVKAGMLTEFMVITDSDDVDIQVSVKVFSPSGRPVSVRVTGSSRTGFHAEYLPNEIGTYLIQVMYGGMPVKGSPFQAKAYDASQVKISEIPEGIVGIPCKFVVDASSAGEGECEIMVSSNGKNVPYQTRVVAGGRREVVFVGQEAVPHQVKVLYNGDRVPGSPFAINFLDASDITASGEGLQLVSCHRQTTFTVHARGASATELKVCITAPDGRDLPVQVKHKGDGTHKVSWTPTSVGDHKVSVTYADLPISGSPYAVQAYDPGNVMVSKIGQGVLGKPVSFNLDASQAGVGNLEIFVAVNGENVPNYVKPSGGEAQFQVSFTPHKPENHLVHVKFNGDPVLGSPFICRILNSDRVIVSGDGLHMATANVLSSFKVDPQGAEGDLNVQVTAPNGRIIPARITGSPASSYCADFTPLETGRHKISVEYADVEVKGSPFYCDVYDPSLVQVKSVGRAYMNRTVIVEVDTSAAGNGHLEAEVKCRGSVVRSNMRDLGNSKYEVSYVPRDVSMHTMSLLFNGYPLQGSPLHMDVVDSSSVSASGEGLRSAQVYRAATFDVDTHGIQDDLEVRVMSPSNSELPCNIIRRGVVNRVEFTPREVGTHTIDAAIAGAPISGSPFYCSAYDPNLVRITDIDQSGKIEREIAFTVDASAAGQGELDASVMHYGHAIRTKRESLGNSHYCYMFTPAEIGQYEVDVWFNNEKIPGCPVIVQVEEEVPTFITINFRGIRYINARNLNWFLLELDGKKIDMNELQIIVRAPNGEQIPASLIPQHDGDYKVEWTPTVPGRYTIDVLFGNRQIQGSPFNVDVFDITKVTVENLKSGNVGEAASFEIDYSNAGKAECLLRVISPTGKSVPFETREGYSRQIVTYFPTESGLHKIYATYGGTDIPGSPTTQDISDGGMPTAHGDGLYKGEEDKPAAFFVDARGLKGDLSVQVDGPNSIAKCNVDPETDGTYTVTYIPVEVGMYNAVVKWKGREIQGSPFHPKIVDARKVRVVGGWQHFMDSNDRVHLIVNEEKQIPFDVSEAGPGKLTAEVKGPNHAKVPVTIDTMSDGKNYLLFTPREEGNHHIYVYWMDHQLVGAPYLGYAVSQRPLFSNDHNKVVLSGRGLKEAVIREEAEFLIDGSEAGPGRPEVRLTGVKTDINVRIVPQDQSRYHCTYLPIFPGAYLLNITWNDRQLRGSPYKVNVIGAAQPNKVMISGEGLKGGLLGKDLHMNIDTRKAGPGELSAHCMGPTETAYCDLEDNRDGTYRLLVQPTEAGRHILQIKFGGEHIFNSPYMLTITARPDASKVRVSGSGVEHGILATFQSKFLVETRGAGAGQLTVRIKGPKGAFQVEMFRDSQKDRVILCRYNPYETGLYVIHIKWSGVDVPGSPFHVHIVDTQQEYERIMQEPSMYGGYSETIPSQLSYNQWKEDI